MWGRGGGAGDLMKTLDGGIEPYVVKTLQLPLVETISFFSNKKNKKSHYIFMGSREENVSIKSIDFLADGNFSASKNIYIKKYPNMTALIQRNAFLTGRTVHIMDFFRSS